jgi:hypothetical protein
MHFFLIALVHSYCGEMLMINNLCTCITVKEVKPGNSAFFSNADDTEILIEIIIPFKVDSIKFSHLKEEALDRIKWRNRFGRGCGPVV